MESGVARIVMLARSMVLGRLLVSNNLITEL